MPCYSIPRKGAEPMIKVGVGLEDRDFARNLVRGLATEGSDIRFSFLEADSSDAQWDLILTDGDCKERNFVQLVRTAEEARVFEGPPYRIFRYDHARHFVGSLRYIFHRESGNVGEFPGETSCKTLAFTSFSGGPQATALALMTGEILYRQFGCRCLYLNLSPLDMSKCFLPDGSEKGLLTLLYHLGQERDFPLSSFIRSYSQIDCIDTSLVNPYFDELDPVRMQRLLKKIDDLGKYSYLILDVGNHFSRCNKGLLAKADEVILVTQEDSRFPPYFLQQGTKVIEHFAADQSIRTIVLQGETAFDLETDPCMTEDGRLDLSALKQVQWEAVRLVKNIMEQKHDA